MTSVAERTPAATSASEAARFRRRIPSIAVARSAGLVRPWRAPDTSTPVPSGLVRSSRSPGTRAALPQQVVGVGGADDREAVLGLRVADRVAAGERAARLADLGRRAGEDLGHHVARQVLGEGRDRQREQDPAAHREDVRQRVRRGDLAERPRVVDERREEVERADDREVVADPVDRRVVGRGEAGDQGVRAHRPRSPRRARPAPRPAGPPRASRRSRRNRSGRSGGTGLGRSSSGHDGDDHGLPSRGSGRVPVGPLVFKTSGAALGAARWVRLPRVPATEDRDCRIARVPRASSGCWSRPGRCCPPVAIRTR